MQPGCTIELPPRPSLPYSGIRFPQKRGTQFSAVQVNPIQLRTWSDGVSQNVDDFGDVAASEFGRRTFVHKPVLSVLLFVRNPRKSVCLNSRKHWLRPPESSPLEECSCPCGANLLQVAVETPHESSRGTVVDIPEGGEHPRTAGERKGPRETDEIVTCRVVREIAAPQCSFARAERDELGFEAHTQNLVNLQAPVVLGVLFELDSREHRVKPIEEAVRRQDG